MGTDIEDFVPISCVWSSYSHRFHGTSDAGIESCITCGAHYVLRDLGGGSGEYLTNSGNEPMYCSGDTSMSHGYERVCEVNNGRECETSAETGVCKHTNHECNCVLCD